MQETQGQTPHDSRDESLIELQEAGGALRRPVESEQELARVLEAFRLKDGATLRGILDRLGLLGRCRLVCHWLCVWYCVRLCRIFCKTLPDKEFTPLELREFARGIARLTANEDKLKRLLVAIDLEDVKAFDSIV